ncbi:HD domain-containing protein [Bacillus suaedae]|uniref:HD domain-containing protein n=1 Tax=Halalkalibacter suaedae TaxID=2822140 RepID=A0A940WYL0_9BACI|nr:HD domain-containing protein [Bacillus suaedae]MBP3950439.1 HD domain-containing protein [Bacillus suaedae]
MDDRLMKQIEFIVEIDKLKSIYRQSFIMDGSRQENDAEHTWHLSMMAIILLEHANESLSIVRVLKMLFIHDIVEIDAGDTFAYDTTGYLDKFEREKAAAERIYGLLPIDQRDELFALWIEFEEGNTAEAQFAAAVDRLQPLLHNFYTEGKSWRKHGITREMVLDRNKHIALGSKKLWNYAQKLIDEAVEKGYLAK